MTAFAGTYSDFKLVKTRGVGQLVIELPIEEAEKFLTVHGLPNPATEKWFGIAAIGQAKAEAKPKEDDPGKRAVTRAVLLCKDKTFQEWLGTGLSMRDDAELWAARQLKIQCGIQSRSELANNPEARRKFEAIETEFKYRDQLGRTR